VLVAAHPDLAAGSDPASLWKQGCDRLSYQACDNARRSGAHRELAVRLDLGARELTADEATRATLKQLACTAGDIFECTDKVVAKPAATLLAEECRTGVTGSCREAAELADSEAEVSDLLGRACRGRDGKACYEVAKATGGTPAELIALWQGACSDKDFSATAEDATARDEACTEWGKLLHAAPELRRAATISDTYCTDGELGACAIAEHLYDRAGEHAKAFAIVQQQCHERGQTSPCFDLAERYVLGNGTPVAIDKGIELLGGGCTAEVAWPVCKTIGHYLVQHHQEIAAANGYASYCDKGEVEACYLRARAFEADPHDVDCGGKPSLPELKKTYDDLCKRGSADSCKRSAGMCARAMVDFGKPADCSSGVGDGIITFDGTYRAVVELCPKASWTPAVRAAMAKIDAECKEFARSGGRCER
jgi:hypothetical protein